MAVSAVQQAINDIDLLSRIEDMDELLATRVKREDKRQHKVGRSAIIHSWGEHETFALAVKQELDSSIAAEDFDTTAQVTPIEFDEDGPSVKINLILINFFLTSSDLKNRFHKDLQKIWIEGKLLVTLRKTWNIRLVAEDQFAL